MVNLSTYYKLTTAKTKIYKIPEIRKLLPFPSTSSSMKSFKKYLIKFVCILLVFILTGCKPSLKGVIYSEYSTVDTK